MICAATVVGRSAVVSPIETRTVAAADEAASAASARSETVRPAGVFVAVVMGPVYALFRLTEGLSAVGPNVRSVSQIVSTLSRVRVESAMDAMCVGFEVMTASWRRMAPSTTATSTMSSCPAFPARTPTSRAWRNDSSST